MHTRTFRALHSTPVESMLLLLYFHNLTTDNQTAIDSKLKFYGTN